MTQVFAYIPQAPKTALETAAVVAPRGPAWTQEQIDELTALTEAAGEDRTQTGLDRTATGQDRTQTGLDRVATGEDRVATAADRAQTGLDRTAAAGSASTATTKAGEAAATAANLSTVLTRTTTTTAVSGQTIAADTSAAPWTLTLPAGGGIVTVMLDDGDTGNALTIAGNGATIDGASTDNTLPPGWTVTFMRAAAAAAWSYSYGA